MPIRNSINSRYSDSPFEIMDKTRCSVQLAKSDGIQGYDFMKQCFLLRLKPQNEFESTVGDQTFF